MTRAGAAALTVRAYSDDDEPAVLELLTASLGGGPAGVRPAEFFRWKHVDNPFGRSFMLVAEDAGRIVGFRSFLRWAFEADGRKVRAARAVDTATHPEYQGRGIFTQLTLAALEELRTDTDLIFNTPNEKSFPGYLKMGWKEVGRVPVSVRVRRPIRFAKGIRSVGSGADGRPTFAVSAEPASTVLEETEPVEALLGPAAPSVRLRTPRDLQFLRWRYGSAPLLDYRAIRSVRDGHLTGLVVFRARMRGGLAEASVADVLTAPGDVRTAAGLLRRVGRSGRFDHVTCSFDADVDAGKAARRAAFVRTRRGVLVVANPLVDPLPVDPTALASWQLTLGDLEVF
jgi:GNAT superfamily N-acetyltransferase